MTLKRLLVFAPTRSAASETFVRANLAGLPFETVAYFGDESPLFQMDRFAYGFAVLLSKICTRLGFLRLANQPAAFVAQLLINHHRPDLVLVEFGFHAVRVMEAFSNCGIPLVVHFRGSDLSSDSKFGVLKIQYKRLIRISSGLICKSQLMSKTLNDLGADAEKILISASGANSQLFYAGDPSTSPPVCLAVGRFVSKKGPLHTIQAFAQQPFGQLWMVGEGPLLIAAKLLVRKLDLSNRVFFLGRRSHEEVAVLMRSVRVFVQHSMVASDGDSEGNPVAVMEAQLSGLPVVATCHGGSPEVIIDSKTGFLVEEGDISGMATAIKRLLADPILSKYLGSAGVKRVEGQFTIEHHLRDLTSFLRRVHSCSLAMRNDT